MNNAWQLLVIALHNQLNSADFGVMTGRLRIGDNYTLQILVYIVGKQFTPN